MIFCVKRSATHLISGTLLFLSSQIFAVESKPDAQVKTPSVQPLKAPKTPATRNPIVSFTTDHGEMLIEMYPEKAPETVQNFLTYVRNGFYKGTIFHRVIPNFVAQGGGYTYDFKKKTTRAPVKNESDNGLKNLKTTLSMARTFDPNSATSQFFINLRDNPHLDYRDGRWGYAVFAKIIKGFEAVEKTVKEPRGNFPHFPDAPNAAVRILDAKIISPATDSKIKTEKQPAHKTEKKSAP